ncbi:LysR family transcriptional regulator [Ferrimonas senticii]|uniref:LysR family transcriptional regulator n=1 Tax=Ferrimonas senticii TaxID=394566 RepID=UPI0003FC2A83|nr:LysR family transcriptional regulator [Ferrimonas senticii]
MKALQDLRIFVETARLGSLSAAARALNLTPAVASAAVKRLEQELGQPLLIRSTRRLRLTLQGERFLEHAHQALMLLDDGCAQLRNQSNQLQGLLQLSAPSDFGRRLLAPWLDQFQQQHPQLQLRLHLSDSIADLYRQPVDLMLRFGVPPVSNMVALSLDNQNVRVLCASPDYVSQYGLLQSPQQLTEHNCLCFSLDDAPFSLWQLQHGDRKLSLQVHGNRIANDGELVHRWALAGHGIAFKSIVDIADDLHHGRLVRLCAPWQSAVVPLTLLCAGRQQLTPPIRALHRFLTDKLTQHQQWIAKLA